MLRRWQFTKVYFGPVLVVLGAAMLFLFDTYGFDIGLISSLLAAMALGAPAEPSPAQKYFAGDSIGGTLARDHQSRAIYFEDEYKRTYVAYMDHGFYARVTYYDYETDQWLDHPKLVDHCIAPNGLKDGHNVPNIFITDDGIIHLFYGSHGHSFKYARSKRPEDITEWETGMRVGEHATYPYLAETTSGELLLFYRYGPTGGYNNPFLAVQHSQDKGKSWGKIRELVTFPTGCKISRAAYDPVHNRVHLLLDVREPGCPWTAFHCMYAPDTGKVLVLGDKVLGPLGTKEEFQENDPMISYGFASLCLYEGTPYFLFGNQDNQRCFGYWDGKELIRHVIPDDRIIGLGERPVIYTENGEVFRVYGIRGPEQQADEPSLVEIGSDTYYRADYYGVPTYYVPEFPQLHGGDLVIWTTTDRGKSWDSGRCLLDSETLGHRLQTVNKVMNYPGGGPFLIVSEITGPWPRGLERDVHNHYDNPSRKFKKLYAVDRQGEIVAGK